MSDTEKTVTYEPPLDEQEVVDTLLANPSAKRIRVGTAGFKEYLDRPVTRSVQRYTVPESEKQKIAADVVLTHQGHTVKLAVDKKVPVGEIRVDFLLQRSG